MKVLVVTGTPGTGKTTLSVKLAKKLDFCYIDVNKIVEKYALSEGYDRKRKTKVVDVKKLNRALIKEIGNYKKLIQSTINKYPMIKQNLIINSNPKIQSNKNKKQKKPIEKMKNNKEIKRGIIIDSHLSHYLPKKYVDLCIVVKCSLKELERRVKKKKYPKDKIRENLDAEIFDICLNEAKETKHKVVVVDTTKGINIDKIKSMVKW
ncbi:MAG: AAA family ATPase [Candidatus Woesearchaeota archaeon]